MKYITHIILITCLLLFQNISFGQVSEAAAREQLAKSGLTEEAMKQKLLEKGIDIDNVDPNNTEEILRIEEAINAILAEQDDIKQVQKVIEPEPSQENTPEIVAQEKIKEIKEKTDTVVKPVKAKKAGLKRFGQQLFQNKELKVFQRSDKIKPSDDYILGPSDEIGVSIWGLSQVSQTYEISERGFISPERMEPIYLMGLSFGEAKNLLEKRFQTYYRFSSSEFKVTLAYARDVRVSIVGEVQQAGTYTLSAINSAVNALMAAGGPNTIGSLREIKLLKPGKEPIVIDIYEYLNNPTNASKYSLMDNDIIHVPVAKKMVSLSGAVIRQGIYELTADEDLVSLFELAGGFKANAVLQNIQLKRYENEEEKIIDINFNTILENNTDVSLKNGDQIYINNIPDGYENYVSVSGAIDIPGKYALDGETKILDVLSKVNLKRDALTDIAYINRLNDDGKSSRYLFINLTELFSGDLSNNLILQPKDKIVIFSKSRYADNQEFIISGAVRDPSAFQLDESSGITFKQALFLAGGLTKDAADYAYIKRKRSNKTNDIEYIKVDISDVNNPELEEIMVLNGDDIDVYSNLDDGYRYIKVDGAVKRPGDFAYDSSLSLQDVLSMAGGFKIEAAPYRVEVYRLQFDDRNKSRTLVAHLSLNGKDYTPDAAFELQPFDNIYVREAPEFEYYKTITINGEVKFKGKYPVLKDNEKITDIIERAGGLTDEAFIKGSTLFRAQNGLGYVVIDLEEALKNRDSHFNLIVQDGDVINIPKINNVVTIIGETQAKDLAASDLTNGGKIHAPYESGKKAEYYIRKYAGGIGKNGKKELITVTFPTGDVRTIDRFLFWSRYPEVRPGSIIRIGSKEEEERKKKESGTKTDWGKVLTDSVAQATAILSLILLVNRVD